MNGLSGYGGSISRGGTAVVDGMFFQASGYGQGLGMPGHVLYAFEFPTGKSGHIWTPPLNQMLFRAFCARNGLFRLNKLLLPLKALSFKLLLLSPIKKQSADIYSGSFWSLVYAPTQDEFRDAPGPIHPRGL